MKSMRIFTGKQLLTKMTQIVYLKHLRSTPSQSRTSFTPGIPLGSIYSGQFKMSEWLPVPAQGNARDCSFMNVDEIVRFLFLTHNQNTRVREELLKSMKTTDNLQDALQIAHLAEGTIHSEELSKHYLDTVKKDAQVDGLNQGKGNKFRSRVCGYGCGHGQRAIK